MYRKTGKRLIDVSLSLVALLVALPLMLVLVPALALANRGTPFFVQSRPGRHGRIFRLIKLKTMNDRRDANGILLPDAERLTPVGRLIRKTSLDELPQLWNVLKGDMSLIGPRPLLVEYLPLYSPQQRRRHEVRPGITGWAQVNGRNALCWEKKFEYDVWYVDNLSFSLDCKIILLTLQKVLKSEGISSASAATMEKFTGTT
ncbi:lipopolysaccharide/colanic/teichoic acid biosynthesis glycosyltransferase [Larkinella arboricola]|uniref:Lipopolysaccharide/colanic/teichoic acid biosynthesis glycosyltransferase n=1 Tax=Larkinella arboricola TaxID=643671 RepID=A0A327WYF1_LARAB|nr:sugar transferase [Larkinella arboricola]RAJ97570.1 lipopolysaccharide/colanic/teichoic acid biosynthesis glycosyltransferase [Larkinella arboricola]